jgi:hypothetical protein
VVNLLGSFREIGITLCEQIVWCIRYSIVIARITVFGELRIRRFCRSHFVSGIHIPVDIIRECRTSAGCQSNHPNRLFPTTQPVLFILSRSASGGGISQVADPPPLITH